MGQRGRELVRWDNRVEKAIDVKAQAELMPRYSSHPSSRSGSVETSDKEYRKEN